MTKYLLILFFFLSFSACSHLAQPTNREVAQITGLDIPEARDQKPADVVSTIDSLKLTYFLCEIRLDGRRQPPQAYYTSSATQAYQQCLNLNNMYSYIDNEGSYLMKDEAIVTGISINGPAEKFQKAR